VKEREMDRDRKEIMKGERKQEVKDNGGETKVKKRKKEDNHLKCLNKLYKRCAIIGASVRIGLPREEE
jgi:hypothetical protein